MRRVGWAVLAVALVAAGCGNSGGAQTAPTVGDLRATAVARVSAGNVDLTPAVRGLLQFGSDLYGQVGGGGNVVVSPLSVAVAFSMARVGARGETAAQLDQVLHFPTQGRDAAYDALTQALITTDTAPPRPRATKNASTPQPPVVAVANGLFVRAGLRVGEAFLRTLAADYGAGARAVDFSTAAGQDAINSWVRAHTADRIKKLFGSLSPDTQLVIANTVYLKANWATPFLGSDTREETFTRSDGSTVTAPTMHVEAQLGYASTHQWQAVALPYAGGRLEMWVIVPTRSTTRVADLLTPTTLDSVGRTLRTTYVGLSLPKWDFGTDLDLIPVLQRVGLTVPFSGAADFSGIAPGLFISQAVHRANITVDERGTEAAAATGIAMQLAARRPPTTIVRADHPFAFAVVDRTTHAPLFIGSTGDPDSKN